MKNDKVFDNEKFLNRLFIISIILIIIRVIFDIVFVEQSEFDNVSKQNIVVQISTTPTPIVTPTTSPTPTIVVTPNPTMIEEPILEDKIEPFLVETSLDSILDSLKKERKKIYTDFSDDELDLLFRVVEAEVTEGDIECKSHVASVIFNRLKNGWNKGNLVSILKAKNQFSVVSSGRYKKIKITEDTIIACELAYVHDTAQDALYFDSTNGKSWAARNLEFIFRDRVGHDFYK